MNVVHFSKDAYGESIYVDVHIPQKFHDKIYFLFGILPFQFRFEFKTKTSWFGINANRRVVWLLGITKPNRKLYKELSL